MTGALLDVLLDALLPPRCLSCGCGIDRQGGLCAACWTRLRFIAAPLCTCCGLPFEFDIDGGAGDGVLCGACIADPPVFSRARAAVAYDDASRPLVTGFKHADQTYAAGPYGRWLARAGADLLADADLLVPVPLHRWRLFRRRYNQAALLALATARASGVAAAPLLLRRRHATLSQGGLGRTARRRNVQGAITVRPGHESRTAGARIVLIDDVFTTGATAAACTRALLQAGAAQVDVLTLARVVKPGGWRPTPPCG